MAIGNRRGAVAGLGLLTSWWSAAKECGESPDGDAPVDAVELTVVWPNSPDPVSRVVGNASQGCCGVTGVYAASVGGYALPAMLPAAAGDRRQPTLSGSGRAQSLG